MRPTGTNTGILSIDPSAEINDSVEIICFDEVTIGAKTMIGSDVYIIDSDHDLYSIANTHGNHKPIHIGSNCWIGVRSIILKGVTLGDNCIVGAGSVVTKSFPDNCIIAGNPAHLLRMKHL